MEGELKLADFGLARGFGVPVRKYTPEVVTLWYRPPDVLMGNTKYSTQVDIWGIGCIFAEMSRGRPLFYGTNENNQLERIFKILGSPSLHSWPELNSLPKYNANMPKYKAKNLADLVPKLPPEGIDLLKKIFQYNPKHRITATKAMKHPYFDELRENIVS